MIFSEEATIILSFPIPSSLKKKKSINTVHTIKAIPLQMSWGVNVSGDFSEAVIQSLGKYDQSHLHGNRSLEMTRKYVRSEQTSFLIRHT